MNSPFVRWLLDLDVIPADAEGVRFAFERPLEPWVWALLILASGAFAAWSYWRLVGRRTGRGILAAVRLVVIWLALILISGPALQLPRESIEQDWVFVLADRSESMTIADAGTNLGAGSGGAAAPRMSRDEQLRRILGDHAQTWRNLAERRHVVWLGFHDGAFDLPASEAGGAGATTARLPVDLGAPDGRRTSLNTSIEQALQRGAARPVSGIVILSDGRTDDPPSRAMIRRLEAEGVPVFVVPLGSSDPLGDLAIADVDAPRRAFIRDKVPVSVELDRLGSAGGNLGAVVRLVDEATGEELDRVDLPAGDDRKRVLLTAKPALAGEATWKVVIDTDRADLIPENNVKSFLVQLVDRPLRVLYVEGYPRWEYRYVKNLLIREKSIASSIMLLSADPDFAQEGNQPITRLPRSPEELADYDVVIIGDVPGPFFSPQQLEMIRDHVSQRGAGLLWIGGERCTPSTYSGTALADLLPMRGALALPPIGVPVNMTPTPVAERLGVLRLISGESSDQIGWPAELANPKVGWSRLFYAQRIEPGRLKPTAGVLAQTSQLFGGVPLPLVISMRYGAGQTIYVATDEIWRWRFGRGELLPEQFWVQMIRMLGRDSLTGAGQPAHLEVEPRRLIAGQPMRIVLRIEDAQLAQQQRASVTAVLETEDGRRLAEIELRRDEAGSSSSATGAGDASGGGPDQFAATYLPSETGQLRVRIDDPDLRRFALESPVEVYRPDDELRRADADHALLASLASETAGAVLTPDQIDSIPDRLPNRSLKTINPLTEAIWDTPLAFALVLLALTAEWIGRKLIRLT